MKDFPLIEKKYHSHTCRLCVNMRRKEVRQKNKEKINAMTREYRRQRPEKYRARDKRYNDSFKGKERLRKFEKRRRKKVKLETLKLTADIPAFIATPYALKVYSEITGNYETNGNGRKNLPGARNIAEAMGINEFQWSNILNGKNTRVSLETLDAICIRGDFNLNEIYDEMHEYAQEHPEIGWPEKFKPRKRAAK